MHRLCREIGVPTPTVYAEVSSYSMLRRLPALLGDRDDFVIKPNRGSAGRGVLVVTGRDQDDYRRHNGELLRLEELQAASVRHPFRDVFAGRPARLGAGPAAHPPAPGVRGDHATRGFPTCA